MSDVYLQTSNGVVILKSVNTPDYEGNSSCAINPDILSCEQKYWKIVNSQLLEMSADEKAVVDNVVTEQKWVNVRNTRNVKLKDCDWTQLADAPLTDAERAAWTVYRQVLRNIPETYSNPDAVVYPTQPAE